MPEQPKAQEAVSQPADDKRAHGEGSGWQHWGLMALCCLPMIVIAVVVILGALGLR